uniref:WRKY domain-containing protein n=1 Tax=Ananas comosus var. bracteatus TaxID=296719 RepID=A0A6V7QZ03_ANACO
MFDLVGRFQRLLFLWPNSCGKYDVFSLLLLFSRSYLLVLYSATVDVSDGGHSSVILELVVVLSTSHVPVLRLKFYHYKYDHQYFVEDHGGFTRRSELHGLFPAAGPGEHFFRRPPAANRTSGFDLSDFIFFDEGSTPPTSFAQFGTGAITPQPATESAYAGQSSGSSVPASGSSTTSGIRYGRGREARTERIAFRMKSEVEIVDDGFRWRKYGKKSVKNSPNPRNYYRCSTEGCSVKKRVERDKDDPSYVITTYEGVHNHMSPGVVYYTTQDAASGRYFVAGCQIPPGSS